MLAIGTRLHGLHHRLLDVFNHDARIIGINAARWDATKHRALAVVGDARETVAELDAALGDWKAPAGWTANARKLMGEWDRLVDDYQKPTNAPVPTYAQVIAAVHAAARADRPDHHRRRRPAGRAGQGLAGEGAEHLRLRVRLFLHGLRDRRRLGLRHGPVRARTPIVMVGDGTYMMMNSDVYSSVLSGHKFILIVCDNGGYGVINRLQNAKGTPGFNNLIRDCKVVAPFAVDFVKHAEVHGRPRRAAARASPTSKTRWPGRKEPTAPRSSPSTPTPSPGCRATPDWDVGVPEVSERESVREARAKQVEIRAKQRVGV